MKYDLDRKRTRGAERTLAAFSSALLDLCAQKPFEHVSASELCERAGYPRATFYNYFDDKYDLLNYCWRRVAEEVDFEGFRELDPAQTTVVFFDRLCDVIDAHAEQMAGIVRHNDEVGYLFGSLRMYLDARVCEIVAAGLCGKVFPIPSEVVAEHFGNTIMLVLKWLYLREPLKTRDQAHVALDYLLRGL